MKIMKNEEITDVRSLVDEYLKCKRSFIYFCQKYIDMNNKVEKLCSKCNYEHCCEMCSFL